MGDGKGKPSPLLRARGRPLGNRSGRYGISGANRARTKPGSDGYCLGRRNWVFRANASKSVVSGRQLLVHRYQIWALELRLTLYWFYLGFDCTLNGHSRGRCPVGSKERRATRRFLMRLPLTVRWTDESVVGEALTESREVSSRGLYFHLPKGLRSGSPVEIVMTLPHELTQAGPVRVRCLGRVLRSSSEHSGEVGVAAAIERYEFMRNGENAA